MRSWASYFLDRPVVKNNIGLPQEKEAIFFEKNYLGLFSCRGNSMPGGKLMLVSLSLLTNNRRGSRGLKLFL
jgi:hypothetical protein